MSSISRYTPHYTVADYEQWRGDWELWDGHAISMSPSPSIRHQRVAGRLYLAIAEQLNKHDTCPCEVLYEVDWRAKDDTVFRPDLLVVCEPVTTTWVETTPTLVIEIVSPGTEKNDRQFKRMRYAELGVVFYLIVDPMTKQIETLRLDEGGYKPVDPADLSLHEGCTLSLDMSAIWA